jgi:hypothetical protein
MKGEVFYHDTIQSGSVGRNMRPSWSTVNISLYQIVEKKTKPSQLGDISERRLISLVLSG